MNLSTFIFIAMMMVLPKNQKTVTMPEDAQRLKQFSSEIAAAIRLNPEFEIFNGSAATHATATLLVATAWGESHLREDIRRCTKKGDGGRSITSFQMMKPWALSRVIPIEKSVRRGDNFEIVTVYEWTKLFTEKQLCLNSMLAANQSMWFFSHLRTNCPRGNMLNIWAGYGTGNCSKTQFKVIKDRCYLWQTLSGKMGLENAYCEKDKKISLNNKKLKNIALKNKKWISAAGINLDINTI